MREVVKCYVSGQPAPGKSQGGIVSFAVPEFGVLFRSVADGSRTDLEIVALFSLLRFAAQNAEIFSPRAVEIFSDYPPVVYLLNHEGPTGKEMGSIRAEAKKIAGSICFSVTLVAPEANRAAGSIRAIPDLPDGSNIRIKSFTGITVRKPDSGFSDLLKA